MLRHIPRNEVKDIAMVVVLEDASADAKNWRVYLVNFKAEAIETVMISSRGYGTKDGKAVKTSVLRHAFPRIEAREYALVELIDEQVFGLTNEYLLSFYQHGSIYDKKFVFLPESIVEENLVRVPLLNKPGVIIG